MEGYKAGVEAQTAIESAYKTSVDAYVAQVQAGVATAQVYIAEYDGQIKAYEAQIDAYKAALESQTEYARSTAAYNQSAVAEYVGQVQAISSYNQVLTNQWEAIIRLNNQVFDTTIKAQEVNGQQYIATQNLIIEANKVGITSAAQLGAAALNALHFSSNSNWSFSASQVESDSISTSTSTNTNYNQSESA